MPSFHRACEVGQLRDRRAIMVAIEGHRIALYWSAGVPYAVASQCPHAGGDLAGGWIEDAEIVCPLHRWRFRLRDGTCSTVRGQWVRRYPCKLRDGAVWIEL